MVRISKVAAAALLVASAVLISAQTAPTAVTAAASSISSNSATLNGSVNPNGSATTVWFEWSTSSSLSYPSSTDTQSLAAGTTAQPVSTPLTGRVPQTTYFFRIAACWDAVCNDQTKWIRGSTMQFSTSAIPPVPLPDGRHRALATAKRKLAPN